MQSPKRKNTTNTTAEYSFRPYYRSNVSNFLAKIDDFNIRRLREILDVILSPDSGSTPGKARIQKLLPFLKWPISNDSDCLEKDSNMWKLIPFYDQLKRDLTRCDIRWMMNHLKKNYGKCLDVLFTLSDIHINNKTWMVQMMKIYKKVMRHQATQKLQQQAYLPSIRDTLPNRIG